MQAYEVFGSSCGSWSWTSSTRQATTRCVVRVRELFENLPYPDFAYIEAFARDSQRGRRACRRRPASQSRARRGLSSRRADVRLRRIPAGARLQAEAEQRLEPCWRSFPASSASRARLEEEAAPETVAAFRRLLPLESRIIHARWSWRGVLDPVRRARRRASGRRTRPATRRAGQILFYPGGVSETEILFPYGATAFASKAGALAGNHFATVLEGAQQRSASSGARPCGKAPSRSGSRRASEPARGRTG